MKKVIKIGTRGSALALQQAHWVKERLYLLDKGLDIQLVKMKTKGDKLLDAPFTKIGGKGLFVKEIEETLLNGEIDLAVHSMKDLPTDLPPGLVIGAIPLREDPRDVLITSTASSLKALRDNARLGTSSLRRKAQILHYRPDLEIIPIRGNLDTRLRKLNSEKLDGIVIAGAGLIRMGWRDKIVDFLDLEVCLPAPGQGALAIEIREDSWKELSFLHSLNDEDTYLTVMAERAFLKGLGGGCQIPIAALGEVKGSELHLTGVVSSPDGEIFRREEITDKKERAEELGQTLAKKILNKEIVELLEKISAI